MRKLISVCMASALLGSFCLAAEGEKSGLFVGVHGGVSINNLGAFNSSGKSISIKDATFLPGVNQATQTSFNAGLNVGWSQFFTPMFGVRGYVSYDFNGFKDFIQEISTGAGSKLSAHDIAANVDLLVNFVNLSSVSFGAYVGIGLGYSILSVDNKNVEKQFKDEADYSGFILPINVGLSATFAQRHRIELGAKIPTLGHKFTLKNSFPGLGGSGAKLNPYVINLGYSFIF